jgi:multisubunit Na+/H+ antiporter MnhF subunit
MHTPVFYIAVVWCALLLGATLLMIVRGRTLLARVLAFDVASLILIALLILFAEAHRASYYLDAALALALVSFVGTLSAARYHGEERIF